MLAKYAARLVATVVFPDPPFGFKMSMRCIIAAYAASPAMASLCDSKHGGSRAERLEWSLMEWMLQVVDEVDDAICVVKHRWLGLRSELGLVFRHRALQ